jgi:DNA-directed RNA polymerase specialized sigma24 family protein
MVDIRSPGVLDSPDALVRMVLAGDETAFARIVRLYRADMVRVSYVITGDVDLAYEAVAATWPHVWDRLGGLDDPLRLRQWLCMQAANEAVETTHTWAGDADHRLRMLALIGRAPRRVDGPVADRALAAALEPLSIENRRLLALRYVAALTPGELACATSLSPARVTERVRSLVDGTDLGQRLRTYASVPVPHVNIDQVARRARLLRHDGRYRAISLAVAIAAAVVVALLPRLGPQPTPAVDRVMTPLIQASGADPDSSPGCFRVAGMPIVCEVP